MKMDHISKLAILILVMGGVVFISVVLYFLFLVDVQDYQKTGIDNNVWSASQLEVELEGFRGDILANQKGIISKGELHLKYDILYSRAVVFETGKLGERLRTYEIGNLTVKDFMNELELFNETLDEKGEWSDAELNSLYEITTRYAPVFSKLTAGTLEGELLRADRLRTSLSHGIIYSIVLGAFMSVVAFSIIGLFSIREARTEILANTNKKLAEKFEMVGKKKAKFLTMISHELRTPMNGMMGSLLLLGQQTLPTRAAELVQQSQRSGTDMQKMLDDIQAYSVSDNKHGPVNVTKFKSSDLQNNVHETVEFFARRYGINFSSKLSAICPALAYGDEDSIARAVIHGSRHLLEYADIENLEVEYCASDESMLVFFRFISNLPVENWELTSATQAVKSDDGMIDGGSIHKVFFFKFFTKLIGDARLEKDGNRYELVLSFPLAEMVPKLSVKLDIKSQSLRMLYQSILNAEPIYFVPTEKNTIPDVILMQAGDDDEKQKLKDLRNSYKSAIIIGLGNVEDPNAYDDVINGPMELERLKNLTGSV